MENCDSHKGSCMCGHISFTVQSTPISQHSCDCEHCRKWSGAPSITWLDFPISAIEWHSPHRRPHAYRSQSGTLWGSCSNCGSSICTIDDENATISIVASSMEQYDINWPEIHPSVPASGTQWWHSGLERA